MIVRATRAGVAAAALALAGCTVSGPDYHRPAAAVADRPAATGAFVGGQEKAFAPAPLPDHWWRLYDDPVLDRLVEEALRANTDLRVAAANIERARAMLDNVSDDRKVQTGLEAAPGLARPSPEGALMPGAKFPPFALYSVAGSVSYQLDLAGQVRRAVEAASADVAASTAAYDGVRVTVVADTTRAYAAACAAGEEIAVAERMLALTRQQSALTRRLIRGGRGIATDALRSHGREALVAASIPPLLAARRVALYRLATLTGKPPAQFDTTVAACRAAPRLTSPIPIGDGAALLARRPDVRRAEWQLHAATARIGVATAALYPRISLGASVGSTGLDSHFLTGDTLKFSLGPLINWEFPNRGRVRARIADAQAQADAAYAGFDGVVLTALRETESALTVYARDLDRQAALTQARDQAAGAVRDATRLYRAGRTGFLPQLDAQRTLVEAEQALAALRGQLAADQVQLFLALGGGWRDTPATAKE